MDFNGNKKLDAGEFEQALGSFGIFPKKVELQSLIKFYDINGDGQIGYEEFLSGLRENLTERRLAIVKKAFSILDNSGNGVVTVSDITNVYDVSMNPEFLEGKKTKAEILFEFLNNFDGARGNNDGQVTWDEFVDYYTDLSMSSPSDDYFVKMMESSWQTCEGQDEEQARATV